LKDFEKETGIHVKAVYDTEETKSTGVLNRLIAEKEHPRCDVFWSGDPMRNSILKSHNITKPYISKATRLIPESFKDPQAHWTGFSACARVLIYNKKSIAADSIPRRLSDMVDPAYKGRFSIANPLFGTTTFHLAALYIYWGKDRMINWLEGLNHNNMVIAGSNGDVKKKVINAEVAFGLTDTDDAFEAKKESPDVEYIFLGQENDGQGALIIPNALSLINESPNPDTAQILFDYLISKKTEEKLARSCAQMPLIKGASVPAGVPPLDKIKALPVDYDDIIAQMDSIQLAIKKCLEK
jgi:iron(III) transport system substrate-binding protein